jgi:hypothetical protein
MASRSETFGGRLCALFWRGGAGTKVGLAVLVDRLLFHAPEETDGREASAAGRRRGRDPQGAGAHEVRRIT